MKKQLLLTKWLLVLCISLFFGFTQLQAQTLSPGDIAIIGVGVDSEDVYLVALKDINAGEIIFITDEEASTSGSFNSGEGFFSFTTPNITAGDVFMFKTSGVTDIEGSGTISVTGHSGAFTLSNSGDGVYIYQSASNTYNGNDYTFLGFAGEDSGDGSIAPGLTEGTTAIYFGGDNGRYDGTRTGLDQAGFLAEIYNPTNWSTSGSTMTYDTTDFSFTPSACAFSFGEATYTCNSNTLGNNNDTVLISIPYTGSSSNITSVTTSSAGVIGGDDPTTVADGTITISGLSEGDAWDIIINGGDCDGLAIIETVGAAICDPAPTTCFDLSTGAELFELVPVTMNTQGDEWTYSSGSYSMNGYCGSGCTEESDTWLVFGPLDTTGVTNLSLLFESSESYSGTDLLVQYTTAYSGCPTSTSWNTLATIANDGDQNIDLSSVSGTDIFIAIQYYDNDGTYSSWSLYNVELESYGSCPVLGTRPTSNCAICDIALGEASYECDAITNGADTVTISIPYTGIENTITSLSTTATGAIIGGDDPALVADGTIIITGLAEGDAWDLTINGGECDGNTLSGTISDVICLPCPATEGDLIITEIMQNPNIVSDDNGEYFEVYNTTGAAIDMLGLVIGSNNASEEFTVDTSVIVPAGGYVIFGKSADTAINGGVEVDYEYHSSFYLGNGADQVTISCPGSGNVIDEVVYDGGTAFPDPTGSAMELSFASYNSTDNDNGANWFESLIPFGDGDYGTPRYKGNYWTGATSTAWTDASNWEDTQVPITEDAVAIPVLSGLTNEPTITSGVTISNLTIGSGATLTVASGAAIVVTGISEGTVTVERDLTNAWHLVSSPVANFTLEDFIADNSLATGTGSNIGLASYDTATDSWLYSTAATTGNWTSGNGYTTLLSGASTVSFTGTIPTTDITTTITSGGTYDFGLVGNPYPAYITIDDLFSANSAVLNENTVWMWDGTQYVTLNTLNAGYIAPSQGFFVSGAGAVSFTKDMQTTNTATFYKTTSDDTHTLENVNQEEIGMFRLALTNNVQNVSTDIYFVPGATPGFDNGYDSSMFSSANPALAVYTTTAANDVTNKLAIQAIPTSGYAQMSVPVGVISSNGGSVTFSLSQMVDLPVGVHIYLQDNLNGTTTQLDTFGAYYEVAIPAGYNGTGDFFLNITNDALATDNVSLTTAELITKGNVVTILNLEQDATLNVYNMLGQKVQTTNLQGANNQSIQVSVTTGTYIVSLETENAQITKKIIIRN
ncbi:lamin tail domain-containing protein [Neptunitalea lumnitzerae]|uniref:LTD domain-containing protein n=1 Tax=Neptunitalea lumnitzerae TaxID=2965509 RepID=A0ABQ5MLQ8_9FLAO|nr:lamin tail domain-containing protein [Neptunitalea sp. Y10]GLB50341.1 hypothetical protein Y10_27090 [Neptunitalea sp. Y10]